MPKVSQSVEVYTVYKTRRFGCIQPINLSHVSFCASVVDMGLPKARHLCKSSEITV
jgi:hypothetical protein